MLSPKPVVISARLGKIMPSITKLIFTKGARAGQRLVAHNAPKDTSALAGSISTSIGATSAKVFSTLPQALPAEFGRRSHSAPPTASLLMWMSRHGIPAEAAFVIAKGIAARGVKGRFFLRKAKTSLRQIELPKIMQEAGQLAQKVWHG